VREGGGGEGRSQKPLLPRDLKFCWLEFAKNFEKFFEKSYGPFLTFLPTFFELAIKVNKNLSATHLRLTDMYHDLS